MATKKTTKSAVRSTPAKKAAAKKAPAKTTTKAVAKHDGADPSFPQARSAPRTR